MRNNLKKNITAILTLLLLSAMGMGIQLTIPTVSATYGDSRWSFAMVEDNINGPEYANGVVFCGSAEDVLYAVNSTDGEQVWNVTLGGDVSGKPWVEGSTIYVTDNSRLYALSTTSGSQLWNYTASGFNNANPIYDNGVIYVLQITGGRIHAVNATTGAQIWNVTTGGSAYYLGHEAFGDDALFIGRTDGTMAAFEMSTGAQRWSVEINNVDGIYAWADYEDGSVFVQTSNMTGWSLDSVDGGVNWSYDFPVGDWVESSGAAEYNGVVCFNVMNGGDGVIYGINATSGVYLWNYTISGITLSIPFAFYGIFYVGCDNGVMYAVNASTGSLAWEYDTTDPYVQGQAAAGDDAVYFLSQSDLAIGTIHAVECYGEAAANREPQILPTNTVYYGNDKTGEYTYEPLLANISTTSDIYYHIALNVANLDTVAIGQNRTEFDLASADGETDVVNILIFSNFVMGTLYNSTGHMHVFSYYTAIQGDEVFLMTYDYGGNVELFIDGVKVITYDASAFKFDQELTQVAYGFLDGATGAADLLAYTSSSPLEIYTSSTVSNNPCTFSSNWWDDADLSGYIFSTNNTGSWVNETWASLVTNPAWANVTKTLNATAGNVVQYQWWCNNTDNNWGDSGIQNLTTTGVPTNDACDSDSEFDVDIDGWVNMTVSHADGVAVLATVDINVSTGDTGYFILRWNQTTNTFSEVEDSANLCTLNASSSARTNLNTTQDRISFYFRISVEANNGDMDVQATTIDDLAVSDTDTYYEEFTMNFYVDIVMTDSAFGWTGLDSGDGFVQLNSDGGSDGYVNYTVSTNDYAYITIKANAENLVSGENTIACGAIQYYDHGSVLRTLTTSYAHLVSVIGPVSESACAFDMYITVPENTPKGTYTLSITINGEQD